jgi:hypothetical protein
MFILDMLLHLGMRTLGSSGLAPSNSHRSLRNSLIHVAVRPAGLISSSFPFSHNLSFSKDASARDVVLDRR